MITVGIDDSRPESSVDALCGFFDAAFPAACVASQTRVPQNHAFGQGDQTVAHIEMASSAFACVAQSGRLIQFDVVELPSDGVSFFVNNEQPIASHDRFGALYGKAFGGLDDSVDSHDDMDMGNDDTHLSCRSSNDRSTHQVAEAVWALGSNGLPIQIRETLVC